MVHAEAFGPKTGVQFASDPAVVRQAIRLLKRRNPRTKVGRWVGGWAWTWVWAGGESTCLRGASTQCVFVVAASLA
jgi:hypothetical protein